MALDRRYVFLLNTAQRALQRYLDRQAAEQTGISVTHAGALFVLQREDGALSGEVAAALDIAPSAMTGLADRMVKAGLIERRMDEFDGRSSRLWLTKSGRAAATQAKKQLGPLNEALTEGFDDHELDVVCRWLAAVRERFPS
ncbi:MarR family winged helix-turn-helix transcriptional regulator [Paraburkholderia megapolitana]|uniref:Transcriptional regulator, MarR family n=1 Tax=Paraburkholderia megapolitana TaxID=420953 RepID=A0A1I3UQQ8_9BURK|nr:MarR family winged helix-turn-helix transcriptional regulator [Paraburkholderia megapolitana]QDQ82336.1 winged helix-turn-helix transcriptional regulator [Paraburkholderia megapolitana]SFJ85714.1 transcriptional regulator, MarR family [Paraburkholderia megapolitana]